jgi:hypothetical protein
MKYAQKFGLLILFVIGLVVMLVAQGPNISGVYTYNLGNANTILKYLGPSGGNGAPVLTASGLSDNGTALTYTGTSMTINATPVITGLGQGNLKVTLTTTAATSDVVTLTGASATSNCTFSAANASAGTNIATTFVSAVATNSVTITHAATANMIYNIQCTPA